MDAEKKPSLAEFGIQKAEAERKKDNEKRTVDITAILIQNASFVGGQMEEERSQVIEQKILDVFNAGYESVEDMANTASGRNSSKTDRQVKMAQENLQVLGDAGVIALNYLYRGYDSTGLPLDGQTGDSIDPLFKETKLEGIGKYIAERHVFFSDAKDKDNFLGLSESIDKKTKPKEISGRHTVILAQALFSGGMVETNGSTTNGRDLDILDYEPPVLNEKTGEWEGGSRWELAPDFAAAAMKYMDYAMRWQSYTPPEWFKSLPESIQGKIEAMVKINGNAANLLHAGKDLDKILGNGSVFDFTHEQLNTLFDDDFKLVVSRMLHDLCEIGPQTTDQNGVQCLRYKEKYYAYDYRRDDFVLDAKGKRIVLDENLPENVGKGVRTVDADVFSKLADIMTYKDKLALFLAKQKQKEADANGTSVGIGVWAVYERNRDGHKKGDFILDKDGERIPGYLCKMNAYTAWNLFFSMGDASSADRKRSLPTFNGIISDAMRTLNPEYKARGKLQIERSGKVRMLAETEDPEKDYLLESENFGGSMGQYILRVARLERDLGRPLDGKKYIRQKIYDRDIDFFPEKTFYGFFDFFYTSRDLTDNRTGSKDRSLADLAYHYATFDDDGNVAAKGLEDFNFRLNKSSTFENEFFDSLDAAIFTHNAIMGKMDVKDLGDFGAKIMGQFGMVNQIWVGDKDKGNDVRLFSYTRNPDVLRAMIIGVLKADTKRLSSDYVPISRKGEGTYDSYVYNLLVKTMGFSPSEVNLYKLMSSFGVYIKPGENIDSFVRTLNGNMFENSEIKKTRDLLLELNKKLVDSGLRKNIDSLMERFDRVKNKSINEDFVRMTIDFQRALDFGDLKYSQRILSILESI